MNDDEILAALQGQRLRLCAFLEELSEDEWLAPSLCAGWSVKDVVAHLTIPTRATVLGSLIGAVRARGDFHRMADQQARARARAFRPGELVEQLRESASSRRRMPGSSPMDPLVDVLVHGQDIALPLGRTFDGPLDLVVPALDHVLAASFTGAPKHANGFRLVATDIDWSHGSGAEARGTANELLLAVLGRGAGLSAVARAGSGAVE